MALSGQTKVTVTSKKVAVTILFGVLLHAASFSQETVVRVDTLTLDQAVALALAYHPSMKNAEALVRVSDGAFKQARAGLLPSVGFTASGSRTEGAFVFNPSIPSRDQKYNSYSAALQVNQLLFDFGKTLNRTSAGSDLTDASAFDLRATHDLVVMNVQTAFLAFLQARRVLGVNEEAVAQATGHLAQARAFYSVGRRPQYDVTKAEVDAANANVNLIRAKNQMQVAQLALENAMGIHPEHAYAVSDSFEVPPMEVSMDSARTIARTHRPELLAAEARLTASRSLARAAWDQHLPTLSAFGTYTWAAFDFPLYSRWNAGVSLAFPIFQGFGIQAQVEQADAAADAARAALDALNESVMLDVEESVLALREANERRAATAKLVEQAEQSLVLAERQYAAGVGTPIDVADAQLTRSNAKITEIQATYDYSSALVRLRRSVGLTTPAATPR